MSLSNKLIEDMSQIYLNDALVETYLLFYTIVGVIHERNWSIFEWILPKWLGAVTK